MGYTHYWRREDTNIPPERWAKFTADVQRILDTTDVDIAGMGGQRDPQVDEEIVAFNGREPEDYESLIITRSAQGRTFGFCKTEYRPYDEVVLAALAAAEKHLGFELESDGGPDALDEGRRTLGEAVA